MRLRAFTDEDFTLTEKWLHEPRVLRWFEQADAWLEEIRQRKTKYNFITHLIAEEDGKPIGFCQYYDFTKGGERWNGGVPAEGSYSLDYLIGEEAYLGKGLGREIIKQLAAEIAKNTDAKRIIAKPEKENKASRNTLLSAGFGYDAENDVFILKIESV